MVPFQKIFRRPNYFESVFGPTAMFSEIPNHYFATSFGEDENKLENSDLLGATAVEYMMVMILGSFRLIIETPLKHPRNNTWKYGTPL